MYKDPSKGGQLFNSFNIRDLNILPLRIFLHQIVLILCAFVFFDYCVFNNVFNIPTTCSTFTFTHSNFASDYFPNNIKIYIEHQKTESSLGSTSYSFMCYLDGICCLNIYNYNSSGLLLSQFINLLEPTGHVMHQQFSIQQLYVLPPLYLCVLYLSENKQRLVPLTA